MSATDAAIAWLAGQQKAQAALLAALDGAAWLVDAQQLTVVHANAAAAQWLGVPDAQALVGAAAPDVLASAQDTLFWADVKAGHTDALASEIELPHPTQGRATVHRMIRPLWQQTPLGQQVVGSWLVHLRDISAQRAAEAGREQALAELRATLEATADGILVQDMQGRVQAFNRRFAELWALPVALTCVRQEEALRHWMRHQVLEPDAFDRRVQEIADQPLLVAVDELALLNGGLIERHTQPLWRAGRPIGRVSSFRLQNGRRVGAPRPRGAEGADPRTGHPNRTALLQRIQHAVQAAHAEQGGLAGLAVLVVAFDPHALFALDGSAGVRQLNELGRTVAALAGPTAQAASLGAGRFGLLLPGASDEAAEALARRLLAALDETMPALPCAVGVAAYPHAGLDAATLLWQAEAGLELAMSDATGPRWRVQRQLADMGQGGLAPGLLDAIQTGRFGQALRLRYLPSIEAATGRIVAAEALLRWIDTLRGEVPPAPWWPHLARAGLAGAVDDWVLAEAVQQGARWRAAGWAVRMVVNVSAGTLTEPGYARRVAATLAQADWPADLLLLDVTAAALQADPVAAEANARALRELGVRLTLDDAGAGDLPLALLRRLPLAALKIDASLVAGLPHEPAAAVVRALVSLAQALGLAAEAEGVETEAQRALVARWGCRAWQGRLYGPPQLPDALLITHRGGAQ